jgi:hypothetical protein
MVAPGGGHGDAGPAGGDTEASGRIGASGAVPSGPADPARRPLIDKLVQTRNTRRNLPEHPGEARYVASGVGMK